jgi:hypothetical protein
VAREVKKESFGMPIGRIGEAGLHDKGSIPGCRLSNLLHQQALTIRHEVAADNGQ